MVEKLAVKVGDLVLWLTGYVGFLVPREQLLAEIVHDALDAFLAASHADCRQALVKLRELCDDGLKLLDGEPGSE